MASTPPTTPVQSSESNELQIARRTDIPELKIGDEYMCKCGDCDLQNGDTIYVCKNKQCSLELFCEDCGPYYHRKKGKRNHAFDVKSKSVVLLKDIIETPADSSSVKNGKAILVSMLDIETYNKYKALLERGVALIGPNFSMCLSLSFELNQFFEATSNAITLAQKAVDAEAFYMGKWAQAHTKPTSIWDFWNNYLYYFTNDHANKLKISQKALHAANHAQKASDAANALIANPLSKATDIATAGAYGMVLATSLEIGVHIFRYFKGDISGREWLRLSGRAIVRNTASLGGTAIGGSLGMMAGCKMGVGIGSALSPGIGTAVGAGVGIIAGIILGWACGKGAEYLYDRVFPSGEEEGKKKMIKEALHYFHFSDNDIYNTAIFNKKDIQKRFKKFALDVHPDRRSGDKQEWHRLSMYYGILKTMVEKKDNKHLPKVIETKAINN